MYLTVDLPLEFNGPFVSTKRTSSGFRLREKEGEFQQVVLRNLKTNKQNAKEMWKSASAFLREFGAEMLGVR